MAKKLYVGNLPFAVTGDSLRSTFEAHGEVVDARIIEDKFTGKSRGFGFVEMANDEEAEQAIEQLNGTSLEGRAIVVNEARPQQKRDRGGRRPDNRGGGRGGHRDSRY